MQIKTITIVLVALALAGCSQSLYMQGRRHLEEERFDEAVKTFYQEISANPKNAKNAWRELGVAYYQKGDLTKSEEALKQASNIKPDARTQLYLGLVYERKESYELAIDAYTASLALRSSGKTAEMTRDHLKRLVYKKNQVVVDNALKNEASIDVSSIPENTIAVPSFDGTHLPPELAPIALGLAEFTAADLAKVQSLTVVERSQLNYLLDEHNLIESGVVDPTSAPRVGRILGSYRIVTATLLSPGEDGFQLNGTVVHTSDSSTRIPRGVEGDLEDIFDLQKEFVFNVIDSLEITLTVEERDAIAKVPTESYLAFLAYCRGLDYRRRGMESAARTEFGAAVREDAGFGEAEVELNTEITPSSDGLSLEQSFDGLESVIGQDAGATGAGEGGTGGFLTNLPVEVGVVGGGTTGDESGVTEAQVKTVTVNIQGDIDAD